MQRSKPLVIAHRGARGLVSSENSIEAFEKAIEVGADMIEFDVRKTQDDQFVCFHDSTLNGVSVARLDYDELQRRVAALGQAPVPLVEDALKLAKDTIRLDVELKEGGYEGALLALIRRYLDYSEFVVKSFDDSTVRALKDSDPRAHAGLLLGVEKPPRGALTRLSEIFPRTRLNACRADFVSPNHQLLRAGFVRRMHGLGFPVYVWTVNETRVMEKVIASGADAIVTDRPDVALMLLGRAKAS